MSSQFLLREEYFGGLLYDRGAEKYEILNRWQTKALMLSGGTPREIARYLANSNIVASNYDCGMDSEDPVTEDMNRRPPSVPELAGFLDAHSQKGVLQGGKLAADTVTIRRRLKAPMLGAPLGIFHLGLTNACNMACVHCYNAQPRSALAREKLLTTEQILSFIDQCREMGLFFVKLQGGEPVLHKEWRRIAEISIDCGLATTLYSGGYFAGREHVLAEVADVPFSEIRLTFGGLRDVHDSHRPAKPSKPSYEAIIKTLDYLLAKNAKVKLNFILGKHNMHQVEEFTRTMAAKSRKWGKPFDINFGPQRPFGEGFACEGAAEGNMMGTEDFCRVNRLVAALRESSEVRDAGIKLLVVFDLFSTRKEFQAVPRVLERDGCGLGKRGFCVSYTGDVGICSFMNACGILPSGGNIAEQNLEELWFESRLLNMGRQYEKEQCKGCEFYAKQCEGICPAMAHYTTGNWATGDPGCFRHLLGREG